MAVPKLVEAKTVGTNSVALTFDQPLDESVLIPLTSFTINYGQSVVSSAAYSSSSIITLTINDTFSSFDRLNVSYEPPLDLSQAIRGTIRPPVSDSKIKRCALRSFTQYRVENLVPPDEAGLGWTESSGLGGEYSPVSAVCEDGSTSDGSVGNGTGRNGNTPTPDDFIMAFGHKEAVQLSNLDNPSGNSVNPERIWMAIQDACSLIDSYISQAPRANKLIISSSRRRVALVFARYYLDSVRRREDVTADYERAIKELDQAMQAPYIKPEADCSNPGNLPAINNGGIIRSWRIPQYYNGVSGKGLSSWWTDSAADEEDDWRTNSNRGDEKNNSESNYTRGGGGVVRNPEQPSEGGGTTTASNPNP
jgi:phage gp36-like protein